MRFRIWHLLLLISAMAYAVHYANESTYSTMNVRVATVTKLPSQTYPLLDGMGGDYALLLDFTQHEIATPELTVFVSATYGDRTFFREQITESNVKGLVGQDVVLKYRKKSFFYIKPDSLHDIVENHFDSSLWYD